jgi:hypothetical protein
VRVFVQINGKSIKNEKETVKEKNRVEDKETDNGRLLKKTGRCGSEIYKQKVIKGTEEAEPRPLKNTPFCPISASDSNFNPRNTKCIPLVKIFVFLDLGQN